MKISLCLLAFFLAFFFETAVTTPVRFRRSPQHYCGRNLANVMQDLCRGKYNLYPVTTQKPTKRSSTDTMSNNWNYKGLTEDYNEAVPNLEATYFMPSSSSMRIRTKRTPESRIVDECCYKPCHVSELLSYCAPGA